ncbi:PIR protein [Plasmodium yoelii yoelii]|uniref:PIR protein n=1 Tax=Plasmodium yoelii yoelii TaxID=73239 RepID=A0AAE9WQG1_PLAYO|nr:PIR protein [Plasmodium yoelii yoelii]
MIFQNFDNVFNKDKFYLDTIRSKNGHYIRYSPFGRESKKYKCNSIFDELNPLCMHLFIEAYKIPGNIMNFKNNNKEYVGYIMTWLGYMLSLKNNYGTNNLKYFYSTFINSDEKYNTGIKDATDYKNLINKKQDLMNMDMRIISKFYVICTVKKTQTSEVISSSWPIANKLFIVLSTFGAIGIFLGISYKYSLFRSRKRG